MSKSAPVLPRTSARYEEDFYAWALSSAALLREKRFSGIDATHLAEEIEDMGKRERRALESHVRNLILHLLKWKYQPAQRSTSWRQSIRNGRIEIRKILRDSPSLAGSVAGIGVEEYPAARADAIDETGLADSVFPERFPFPGDELLDAESWPP
ncbi:MAG: DUF29 domain-containing protein [Gammaproteobacteria bacterium]